MQADTCCWRKEDVEVRADAVASLLQIGQPAGKPLLIRLPDAFGVGREDRQAAGVEGYIIGFVQILLNALDDVLDVFLRRQGRRAPIRVVDEVVARLGCRAVGIDVALEAALFFAQRNDSVDRLASLLSRARLDSQARPVRMNC